jgi:hypothetical protein
MLINCQSKKGKPNKWNPYGVVCTKCHRLMEMWSLNEGMIFDEKFHDHIGEDRTDLGDSIYAPINRRTM